MCLAEKNSDPEEIFEFYSPEAEAISQVLSAYIRFNLREQPELQLRWNKDYESVGRLCSAASRRNSVASVDGRRFSFDSLCSDIDTTGLIYFCFCLLYFLTI